MQMRKKGLTRGEKILYTGAVLCICFTFVLKIFCGAGIGHLSMSVEQLKYDIDVQEKTNESLAMTINELASLTKIQEVAEEQGLSYNNNNIKTITENK